MTSISLIIIIHVHFPYSNSPHLKALSTQPKTLMSNVKSFSCQLAVLVSQWRDTSKPGPWTLDWTMDWTVDRSRDDHYQSFLGVNGELATAEH